MEKKVLIVEDDLVFQRLLIETLKDKPYQVLVANDGLQGLEMVKENKPDIILLDIVLPKMDGLELLKEVRKDDSVKGTTTIVLTSMDSSNLISGMLLNGVTEYLVKDKITQEEILQKVEDLLEG